MEIQQTRAFVDWLSSLRDQQGKARILSRIDRLAGGNPGDHRQLKGGISELRLKVGPGYRVYYTRRGETLVILLRGGDKSTQENDIALAQSMASQI